MQLSALYIKYLKYKAGHYFLDNLLPRPRFSSIMKITLLLSIGRLQ